MINEEWNYSGQLLISGGLWKVWKNNKKIITEIGIFLLLQNGNEGFYNTFKDIYCNKFLNSVIL